MASGMLFFFKCLVSILRPFRGGRGGGVGFHGGGFNDNPNGYGPPSGPGGMSGGPQAGGGGYGGGGYRSDLKREGPGGFDDRDHKRPRY